MDRTFLKDIKRVVIKIDTHFIMQPSDECDHQKLDKLAFVCSTLQQQGREVVIVNCGEDADICTLYKKTSVMQGSPGKDAIMHLYSSVFQHYGQYIAQIVMPRGRLSPLSYTNCKPAIHSLLGRKIIPFIKWGDALSRNGAPDEGMDAENDGMAAIITECIDADLLIILSDTYGGRGGCQNISTELFSGNSRTDTETLHKGTDPLESKRKAARYLIDNDKSMIIMNPENPALIFDILDEEAGGTLFKKGLHDAVVQKGGI